MKDDFLLADSKSEVCHERVLLLQHLKKYQIPSWVWCKAINQVKIIINSPIYK